MIRTNRKRRPARTQVFRQSAVHAIETLEDRTLLSGVTAQNVETGLNQLGSVVDQAVGAVQLLNKVPFLGGLSSKLTTGAQDIQSNVNALISAYNQVAQAGETAQAFLDQGVDFKTSSGELKISNIQSTNGGSAIQFTLQATPTPLAFTFNVNGDLSFGHFNGLNLGQFTFNVSNQIQVQAVVQIDSAGNITFQRSTNTFITDTPTISLGQQLTVTGDVPAPGGLTIPITGFIGGSNGLSISPQVMVSFGTQNDFVSLSTLVNSATPSVTSGETVDIPFGVGITMNSGDQGGDQIPALVYQNSYQFDPINGTLTPSNGQILVGGVVVENEGDPSSVNTAVLAGAVLHDIAGPMFDKYESYIPQDVRDFLLGNTVVAGQPLKTYLFGESPLDLAALALEEDPPASIGVRALQNLLEVGQYGSMLDNLNPSDPTQQLLAQQDQQDTEQQTGIEYNILDDPIGTVLDILSGQPAPLVTWKIDAVNMMVSAANEYLTGSDDPTQHALELQALEAVGLIQKINPNDPNSQLEITIGNPAQLAQNLVDALQPLADQLGIGKILDALDQVFQKISNLGLNFSFTFYGGATFGVNSSFLTDPTSSGVLNSLFISAPGMNGPGTFGNLLHMEAHASINIDLPQDLTGSVVVAPGVQPALSAKAVASITPSVSPASDLTGTVASRLSGDLQSITPFGYFSNYYPQVSAGNGQLTVGNVSIGGAAGGAASAVAGAFPGGGQAALQNLINGITDPAGTFSDLVNKLASVSLHMSFDVNDLDVSIPAGDDPSTPTELTVKELLNVPTQCILTFKADATVDVGGSLSAVGQDAISGDTGQIPLLEVNTQCNDNPFLADANQQQGFQPFAMIDPYSNYQLDVSGTTGNDVIVISQLPDGEIQVTENGNYLDFPSSGIFNIQVNLNGSVDGGNDTVLIDPSLSSSFNVTVDAGSGNDLITAQNSSGQEFGGEVEFQGGAGNDTLIGGAGYSNLVSNDVAGSQTTLEGGSGQVNETAGAGNDILIGGTGTAESDMFGSSGCDTFTAGNGYSYMLGTGPCNVMYGPTDPGGVNASGVMIGGPGNNFLDVGQVSTGNWVLIGGQVSASNTPFNPPDTGKDIIVGGYGNAQIISGDAYQPTNNTFLPIAGTGGPSAIFGGPGNDTITTTVGGNFISGGWLGSDIPAGNDTINAITGPPTSWGSAATLPGGRDFLAATAGHDGKIYAMGGDTTTGLISNELDAYNPATNSWTQLANLPNGRDNLGAAVGSDGTIYAIGGYSNSGYTGEVDAYNPATNTWKQVASMPNPRGGFAATAGADGKIYVIGGLASGLTFTGEVDVYDPSKNTWSQAASLPTATYGLAATTGSDGTIYALGGVADNGGSSTLTSAVAAYNPATNVWTPVAFLPTARQLLGAAAGPNGTIYAIGGNPSTDPTDEVDVYDPSSKTWSPGASLPDAREAFGAATGQDGKIYVVGGHDPYYLVSEVDVINPATDTVIMGNVIQASAGGALVPSTSLPPGVPNPPTVDVMSSTAAGAAQGLTRDNGSAATPLVIDVTESPNRTDFFRVFDVTNPANPILLAGPVQPVKGTITISGTPLADGPHKITVTTATSPTGTQTAPTTPTTITIQSSVALTGTSPSNGAVVAGLPNGQIAITFSHPLAGLVDGGPALSSADASAITLTPSGAAALPITSVYHANADGTSTIDVMPQNPLGRSTYTLHVDLSKFTDLAGNTPTSASQGNATITVTGPPNAPQLSAQSDTGASSTDGLTRDNGSAGNPLTFNISGVQPATGFVQLYVDGNAAGSPVQASAGSATITLTGNPLSDGPHQIAATAAFTSGGTPSTLSGASTITIQTSVALLSTTPASGAVLASLPSNQVAIAFSHALAGLVDGGSALSSADPSAITVTPSGGAALAITTVYHLNADGTSTIDVAPQNPLGPGAYTLHIDLSKFADLAGNTPTDPNQGNDAFTIMSAGPPDVPQLSAASDTGMSDTDGLTRDNGSLTAPLTFTVAGVSPANGYVQLYDGGNPIGSLAQAVNGTATITLSSNTPLADGIHHITATAATAPGGTQGPVSSAITITIQTSLRALGISPLGSSNFLTSLPNNQIILNFSHPIAGLVADDTTGHGFRSNPFAVMLLPSGPEGSAHAAQTGSLWTAPSGYDSGNLPVPAIAVYHENSDGTSTITLTAEEPLASDVYLVSVNSGLTDLAGNPMADQNGKVGTVYYSFAYRPTPVDNSPLHITSITAHNGTTPITPGAAIAQPDTIGIRFNKPLDPWQANSSTVHLFANGALQPTVAAYSPSTDSIYLTPEATLSPGTQYFLVVDAALSDDQQFPSTGNALGQTSITEFTVTAPGVSTGSSPLTVSATTPANGDGFVQALGYVAITLSEGITLSSANVGRFSAMLIPQTGGTTTGASGYADVPYNETLAFNPNTNQLIIVPTAVQEPAMNQNSGVELISISNITGPHGDSFVGPGGGPTFYATFRLLSNTPALVASQLSRSAALITTATPSAASQSPPGSTPTSRQNVVVTIPRRSPVMHPSRPPQAQVSASSPWKARRDAFFAFPR